MNNFDFVVHIGTRAPEKKPNNVLNTPLANWALDEAYKWAESKADKNIFAANAKVYIESIEANREYERREPDKADYLQLLYILANLRYWRGSLAKLARQELKRYTESLPR